MEITQTEIVLTQLRRGLSQLVSPEVLSSFRVETHDLYDRLGKQVTMLLDLPKEPVKTLSGATTYEFPATWFNHLRNSHFPRFLTKYFPIKYTTIKVPYEVEVGAVYPKLPHAFPKYGGDMRFYDIQQPSAFSMRTVKDGEVDDY